MIDHLRIPLRKVPPWWAWVAAEIIIAVCLFIIVAWYDHRSIVAEARNAARKDVEAIRHHANDTLHISELISEAIQARLYSLTWDEISASRPIRDWLKLLNDDNPQVDAIWLFDAGGMLRNASRLFRPDARLDGLDGYTDITRSRGDTLLGHGDVDGLLAEPHVNFVRKRVTSSGIADGNIVISVSTAHLMGRPRSDLPSVASLFAPNLTLLARAPAGAELPPQPIGAMRAALDAARERMFIDTDPVDGLERVFALRRIPRYGLYVTSGIDLQQLTMRWYAHLHLYGIIFGAATLVLLILTRFAFASFQRIHGSLLQRQKRERLEMLGRMTERFAHDLGNIFTGILLSLETLHGRMSSAALEQKLETTIFSAEWGAKAVRSLLLFARDDPPRPQAVDMIDLFQDSLEILRQALGKESKLQLELPATWTVMGDPFDLKLALMNLAMNAHDAMPNGGQLFIALSNVHLSGTPAGLYGDFVRITASHTSVGKSKEVASRATQPFFTTKQDGGLTRVQTIANRSGGTLTVDSTLGCGTSVTIYLRRAAKQENDAHERDPMVGDALETVT